MRLHFAVWVNRPFNFPSCNIISLSLYVMSSLGVRSFWWAHMGMFYCFTCADDGRVTWAPNVFLLKTETVQHAIHWNKTYLRTCSTTSLGKLLFRCKIMIVNIVLVWWVCDSCIKLHHLLFHGILYSSVHFPYLQIAVGIKSVEIRLQQRDHACYWWRAGVLLDVATEKRLVCNY